MLFDCSLKGLPAVFSRLTFRTKRPEWLAVPCFPALLEVLALQFIKDTESESNLNVMKVAPKHLHKPTGISVLPYLENTGCSGVVHGGSRRSRESPR